MGKIGYRYWRENELAPIYERLDTLLGVIKRSLRELLFTTKVGEITINIIYAKKAAKRLWRIARKLENDMATRKHTLYSTYDPATQLKTYKCTCNEFRKEIQLTDAKTFQQLNNNHKQHIKEYDNAQKDAGNK